tara:strand:- start:256 stop:441 length:186 start_codon:yes stop_codon:yes gene_type:complete
MEENSRTRQDDSTYGEEVMELLIGILGLGMFLFWGYSWIVSHLHYDIHLDDDTESYEGELL